MQALSRNEVRAVDRCAIEQLAVSGVVLMENAGRCAADAVETLLEADGGSVAIVAGAGNNGGDGYVIARHLCLRGRRVETFLVAPREKITGDALINLRVLERIDAHLGGRSRHTLHPRCIADHGPGVAGLAKELATFDVVVDAVGGTGIEGALRGDLALAVEQINTAASHVVAVDIPTGLDADTGAAAGPAVRATLTVTFVAPKKGFAAPGASDFTGRVVVADIGVPAEIAFPS